ncbi:MAG: tetratricopeptide repeat protein [Gemmatimonadota bacterium]
MKTRFEDAPDEADAGLDRARGCLGAGNPGEAFLYLRLSEGSATRRGEVRRLMGMAHLQTDDVEAAVEDLLAASRAYPGDPEIEEALARALDRLTEPSDPSTEERAAADEAVDLLVGEPAADIGLADADPFDRGSESHTAALEALLRTIVDSCAEPEPLEPVATPREDSVPEPATAAADIDLERLRSGRGRTMPGHPATTGTLLLRRRGSRTRRALVWVSSVVLTGALAFGAVVAHGTRGGFRTPAPPAAAATRPADDEPRQRPASQVLESPPPAPPVEGPDTEVAVGESRPGAEGEIAPAAAEPAPEVVLPPPAVDGYDDAPRYEFMTALGLPAPPGGIIDPSNSDARRVIREGLPRSLPRPVVLTFRTEASVEEVVHWYAEGEAALRFNQRVVPMGGPFLGVQRTVARAGTRVGRGHNATVTVSRPGVDPAGKTLIPQTTVRIEIR